MDGRKTEAIIVQMQLVSVCGLPICVNVQLFYIWSHNIRKLLNNSFYQYEELNIQYKGKIDLLLDRSKNFVDWKGISSHQIMNIKKKYLGPT